VDSPSAAPGPLERLTRPERLQLIGLDGRGALDRRGSGTSLPLLSAVVVLVGPSDGLHVGSTLRVRAASVSGDPLVGWCHVP
jgi:hypothetical protein